MQKKKTIILFLVGALAVAGVFGAIGYKSVFAATPIPAAPGTSTSTTTTQANAGWGMGKGIGDGITKEDLANALGITTDQLKSAYQAAYKAALDQAVSKGLITQAQEDQLISNGKAFPFGERWEGWLAQNGIDFNTYLAQALDISVDKLQAAYKTAFDTRVDQAVTNGKITQEQADLLKGRYALYNDSTFQSSMQNAYKDAVNQAVASGVITQAQADQILAKSGNMFKGGFGGFGGIGGFGGGRHGRGGGWMGGGMPQTAP